MGGFEDIRLAERDFDVVWVVNVAVLCGASLLENRRTNVVAMSDVNAN